MVAAGCSEAFRPVPHVFSLPAAARKTDLQRSCGLTAGSCSITERVDICSQHLSPPLGRPRLRGGYRDTSSDRPGA